MEKNRVCCFIESSIGVLKLTFGQLGMKEWIIIVVPISPIVVVSIFLSMFSFPANQRYRSGGPECENGPHRRGKVALLLSAEL